MAPIHENRHPAIDVTDWVKAAAIVFVTIDHIGLYFVSADDWWRLAGRLAAPVFFFLVGFAHTRKVPAHWIVLGIFLTLLDSWGDGWTWPELNILLSFGLVRWIRPCILGALKYGWPALVLIIVALLATTPLANPLIEYGAEGWLWALFGICQRIRLEQAENGDAARRVGQWVAPAVTGVAAAIVYVWFERQDFAFTIVQSLLMITGTGVWLAVLLNYRRGPSSWQPNGHFNPLIRFAGHRTLELYVVQLVASELLIKI